LRGECRAFSGVTVVTNARAYYQYTRGCGRIGRPAFPAPSESRGPKVPEKLARMRGEIAKLRATHSIAYPPPGLAFGEPDDRLQRVSSRLRLLDRSLAPLEYWIIRFRFRG
jgi:hypothetical protein